MGLVMCLVTQLCLTLCDYMDCSPPDSSVHGILQGRILEWVAIPFSRGSSQLRDQIPVSHIAGRFFTVWATRQAQNYHMTKQLHYWAYILRKPHFFFFLILFLLYFTLQYCIGFAIHWHESATGVYELPILNRPPTSHPISSLWIIPMHQSQAFCILYRT